ncbi:hypothetical protein L596_024239 [Steinernema carpocapsae]|uniref:N-acetyltransferase domain-containing protein n=1 Tax=Steinernema carpocapsae TaxID=34508 RepID=A0A4U5MG65_STECR|nr:hypothetical protein L596_024239 [Steinernema carpocapsae]
MYAQYLLESASATRKKSSADSKVEYRLATPEDYDIVLEFTKSHFFREEPVCRNLVDSAQTLATFLGGKLKRALQSNLSALVIEKTTGELVGYRIATAVQRNAKIEDWEGENEENTNGARNPAMSASALEVFGEPKKNVWGCIPEGVDKIVRVELLFVRKDHQNKGIEKKLMKVFYGNRKLKEEGYEGILSDATSIVNQKLLAKDGFEPLKELLLADFEAEDGSKLPSIFDNGTTKLVLSFKRL